ncbi:tRNA (adenosine(37)-N6)-threonylcarbamoyltransferase complex ATPase subunit type 1 TsaE, partial [Staphylococcus epidermidis]|uniref:tRNA (adenosine(37)-N6)-threonylcarbamoyltransferase complex ATPase subunit type 1 TsaE n=1 Tax=Staphylococcus epidermidis TaxID=1282 RepID=UPI00311EDC2D
MRQNMLEFKTTDPEQTIAIAKQLGQQVQAGDVLLLDGDLGAGKTTFTKGLAAGLGIDRYIKSPTVTLIR